MNQGVTFAVLEQRRANPGALRKCGRFIFIQDFISIPLGRNIQNNLDFGKKLTKAPVVFGVNYFLRDKEGKFVNSHSDKHVWVKWMELRAHGEAECVRTPTGLIPRLGDLQKLFTLPFHVEQLTP
jgi:GTP-dependent phosphoenolpyruvate carboxykinase